MRKSATWRPCSLADAAVCHFSAKIGEQEIVAKVQDRETLSPNIRL